MSSVKNVRRRTVGWHVVPVSLLATTVATGHMEAARAQETGLAAIVVEGTTTVVTEGKDTYTTDRATVGGKQPQELKEVPQTITVITRQRLEDGDSTTLEEAGDLVAGLTTALGSPWRGSLYSRGQEVFQYYVDGAPRPYLSIYGTAPDLSFFDRVEIMSGPSGVFQGSGEPVGTLNLVRKRARSEFGGSVTGTYHTFDGYRGEVDVTGALNASGSLRGRLVAYGENEESYIDIIESERGGVYGTLEADITDRTTVSVGSIVERHDTIPFSGLPTFTDGTLLDVSRDTFIGAPWNNFGTETWEAFAELEHTFQYGGVMKLVGRRFERETDIKTLLGLTGVNPATNTFRPFTFARDYEETSDFLDANLTSPIKINGQKRGEFVVGADYRRTDQTTLQIFDPAAPFLTPVVNIFSFDPNAFPEPAIQFRTSGFGAFQSNLVSDEYGLYTQGRIEIAPGLKINAGGRFAKYESNTRNLITGALSTIEENEFIPYAGATYDVTKKITAYGSYAQIFQPQTELAVDGTNLSPRIGTQVEFGVKAKLFDGRVDAQASYYVINDENRAQADTSNIGFFVAAGEAETKGVEFTIGGKIGSGTTFTTSYAYVETELTNDPSPAHSFAAFAKYEFQPDSLLNGFTVGAGLRAVSEFDNFDDPVWIRAPGFAVVDALLAYDFNETLGLQLNVTNLFDKQYVSRVNEVTRGTFFGEPLNATLKLKKTF